MAVERGRATRERLIDAAVALVGEAGWGGVTTRRVAERAGVRPGLVHYHFASLEDLLVTACVGAARPMLTELLALLRAHRDLDSGLATLLTEMERYTSTAPAFLMLTEAFLAAARIPRLRAELAGLLAEFRTGVTDWLTGLGHGDGAGQAAIVLAAAFDGLILHRALDATIDLPSLAIPLRRMLG